jgi:phage-Barnase-EndoU-ColicinE5/D-RelE like nuclease3
VGIDKGFDYAPGANTQTPLRQFVQDKLVTYPDAIATVLSRDVNRYVNATTPIAQFAAEALTMRQNGAPLWLGFVERFQEISALVGVDVKGFMLTLPSETVRHIDDKHGSDGGSQRPPLPADFERLEQIINQADTLTKTDEGPGSEGDRTLRFKAIKEINGEKYTAVFEARPGKKNRALALVTYYIKTALHR